MATDEVTHYPIRCYYYDHKHEVIHTNAAYYPRSAVWRAQDHMNVNDYGAFTVEVIDITTGALHAVITRSASNKVEALFKSAASSWRAEKE